MFLVKSEKSWYDKYLADLDALSDAILDYMDWLLCFEEKNARRQRVEEDLMAGTANLVDAMLVIAVGFLVFLIISWNMHVMIDPDTSVQEQMQKTTIEID